MGRKMDIGVVTYNPDLFFLNRVLTAVNDSVEHCTIVDNGSSNQEQLKRQLHHNPKISIILNEQNLGIAKALNEIMDDAKKRHTQWVMFLDQDSFPSKAMIDSINSVIKIARNDEVMVCPSILTVQGRQFANRGASLSSRIIDGFQLSNILRCITSGSCINTKAFELIGNFDEKLFIDEVDYEYCRRLRESGYSILRIDNLQMLHEVISNDEIRTICLFGKKIQYNDTSVQRQYYKMRNLRYLSSLYENYGNPRIALIKMLIKVLLFENKKMLRFRSLYKGFVDGKDL